MSNIVKPSDKKIEVKNTRTNKYRIIQTLLMISGIVLIGLGGFGVLSAGIFAGLAIGLGNFFVTSVLASIFTGKSGYRSIVIGPVNLNAPESLFAMTPAKAKFMNRMFYLSIAIALISIALITCGALEVMSLGMACSIGIPIFFVALDGIISNNETLKSQIALSSLWKFLSVFLFRQNENIVLLGSIVTCLALGIMTLLGTLNLMFAIGLMTPLLVGSVIFKIVVVVKKRYALKRISEENLKLGNSNVNEQSTIKNLDLNNNKDNKDNLKDNQAPLQNNFKEEKDLNNSHEQSDGN